MIAVEADEMIESLKKITSEERLQKQKDNASNQFVKKEPLGNLLPKGKKYDEKKTYEKIVKNFHTNRTYEKERKE